MSAGQHGGHGAQRGDAAGHDPHDTDHTDHAEQAGHADHAPHEHGTAHDHPTGPLARVKELFAPHSHDAADSVDTELETSRAIERRSSAWAGETAGGQAKSRGMTDQSLKRRKGIATSPTLT